MSKNRNRRQPVQQSAGPTASTTSPSAALKPAPVVGAAAVTGPSLAEQEASAMRVGFRQASIESFLANRMEIDKSLLTLSVAGLGAVLAIWTTLGVHGWIEFSVELVAAIMFITTVGLVLLIFRRNAEYTSRLIQSQAFNEPGTTLKKLDWWTWRIFTAGVVLSMIGASIGTIYKWKHPPDKPPPQTAPPMTNDPKKPQGQPSPKPDAATPPASPRDSGKKPLNESVEGLHRLDTGSLHGLHDLAPKDVKTTPPPTTSEKPANPRPKKP